MITQSIDNVSFCLKESCDFSFLSKYGKFFCVFDQHDSGNISFGADDGRTKYFIKVAGAKTMESCRDTKEAAEVLKNVMPIYEVLQHPKLIQLVENYEQKGLYIAVFKWAEGECLFDFWNFEKYSKNPLILSPYRKFKLLPIEKRLNAVRAMFEFLVHVESMGYVAVDFYDGSIMYDFDNDNITICDIDFFRKKPTYNNMGEDFWGTKRLKSPEEYIYGAVIDEATNVYTMGALLFHFFGNYSEEEISQIYQNNRFFPCAREQWGLSEELYKVSLRAVEEDRSMRYQSMSDFYTTWNKELNI